MLPERTINWVVQNVDPRAHVDSIEQLKGSTSSSLYAITLQANDLKKKVVLRLFDQSDWVKEEPDVALHEANSLQAAHFMSLETPHLIAYDQTGVYCDAPAVLMTHVEGHVELHPSKIDRWMTQLAETLGHIHASEVDHFGWSYFPYTDVQSFEIPTWAKHRSLWQQALDIVQQPAPSYTPQFIHRDYHPTNVLWKDGSVSGVVDWVNACMGPAGVDVGHCRVNLALLYGVKEADHFLAAYEKQAEQTFTYNVYWDLISVCNFLSDPLTVYPGWEAFGMYGMTVELMEKRLDAYMKTLIERS